MVHVQRSQPIGKLRGRTRTPKSAQQDHTAAAAAGVGGHNERHTRDGRATSWRIVYSVQIDMDKSLCRGRDCLVFISIQLLILPSRRRAKCLNA